MLDREALAHREVGHTNVSPLLARVMVAAFLVSLALLPALEIAGPSPAGSPSAWSHLRGMGEVASARPGADGPGAPAGAWNTVVTANRAALATLSAFETALEDQSVVGKLLRPPTQYFLTGFAGAGNERVYVGRDGWLFYRPDVDHVTGSGFLDERHFARRLAAASEYEDRPHPDPRPAILQFARDLHARGIVLVLMPTPVKPTVHPGQLASDAAGGPLHNSSYATLLDELRRAGVLIFDPADALVASRDAHGYLRTDTHWQPAAMAQAAQGLAAFLRAQVPLPEVAAPGYTVERREARATGDTAAMLDLPAGQTLFPPERVVLRFVVDAAGDPWAPDREADVLLLGDSFTNIYSLASMGWGESAGLAEHLSEALQRPLDRIVQNDQGAVATRAMLQRELQSGTDRLAGKRVVIWQFAAREFSSGDWRPTPLPSGWRPRRSTTPCAFGAMAHRHGENTRRRAGWYASRTACKRRPCIRKNPSGSKRSGPTIFSTPRLKPRTTTSPPSLHRFAIRPSPW
jgi:hypothetical protein